MKDDERDDPDRSAKVEPATHMTAAAADPVVAAVYRAFFTGDRLQAMPAKRSKRLIVLDRIARAFEPGVRYPEAEVNTVLGALHPDYAMLRRYLVDEQFLSRDHGIYWRIGGSVDV